MPIDWRTVTIDVKDPDTGGPVKGHQEFPGLAVFPTNVRPGRATLALNGFTLDYAGTGDSADHHMNVIQIDTDLRRKDAKPNDPHGPIHDNLVHFVVESQYADRNFDDPYSGKVEVTVIADLV